MAPEPENRTHVDSDETDWRANLVPRISAVAVAVVGLGGVAVLAGFQTAPMGIFGLCLVGWAIVMIGLLATRRISNPVKSTIVVGSMSVAAVVSYIIGGFLPGSALAVTAALVFAALLLGRTALIITFSFFMVLVVGLTVSITAGLWQGPHVAGFDPQIPANWIRTSFVSIIIWAGVGFSVTFVIVTIETNLARLRAALVSLRKEMAERRAAEAARREAEAVANQAQKMEAVGQLAAAIAHDFNNALLVIKGWNEMRGKTDSDDRQREATEAIEQATEHSARLGRQLLTFSRKDIRTPRVLRLNQLVTGMAESLRHLIGPHIELTLDTQANALVYADESQLQQLLFNLVINARDAVADSGNIRISVHHVPAREFGDFEPGVDQCVALVVEDDGPGIDDAIQTRVFDPFFTSKSAGKGTGLGLTTVANIVQQSGGHIDLQSQPGKTRFSIILPATEADSADIPDDPQVLGTGQLGFRVLVLEDDPQARNMIVSALTLNGNEVLECDSGEAAVSLLSSDQKRFDLLCSDAVFPGDQLSDVLGAFERHSPEGRVLICSGYVQEELAIRKLESGEYAFLAKPFTGSQLIARIHDIVN